MYIAKFNLDDIYNYINISYKSIDYNLYDPDSLPFLLQT